MARLGRSRPIQTQVLRKTVVAAAIPKISTFTETFDTLNTTTVWQPYNTVAIVGGQLQCTPVNTPPSTANYSGVTSFSAFDLTESSFYMKVTAPTGLSVRETSMSAYQPSDAAGAKFVILDNPRQLMMQFKQAYGAWSNTQITYDPVAHAWLRIGITGTNLLFDTSPDGVTWTNRRTVAVTPANFTSNYIDLSCGHWGYDAAGALPGYFDNINTLPSGQALTYSATDSLGLTDSVTFAVTTARSDTLGLADSATPVFTPFGAVSYVRRQSAAESSVSGTTVPFTLTASVPAGNLLVAMIGMDNLTAATPTITSIDKMAGETADWVLLAGHNAMIASAGSAVRGEMWAIQTTIPWDVQTFNATLSGAVTKKVIIVSEFSGASTVLRNTPGSGMASGGVPTASTSGTAVEVGDLVLGGATFENNLAPTPDADTLGGAWSSQEWVTSISGGGSSNVSVSVQYKFATTNDHQTFNPTGLNESGAVVAVLLPTAAVVAPPPVDLSDGLGLTDSVSIVKDATYTATDALGLTDARTSNTVLARVDTEGLTDVAANALATSRTDSLGLTDDAVPVLEIGSQALTTSATDDVGLTDSVSVVIGRPKAEVLTDTFDTQVDPAVWTLSGTGGWDAGRASLTELNGGYSYYSSVNTYDLTDSSVYARIIPSATPAASTEMYLAFKVPGLDNNGLYASIWQDSGLNKYYVAYRERRGFNGNSVRESTAVYDPVNHAYFRLRSVGQNVYWDTSPDGTTWTQRKTLLTTLDLTGSKIEMWAGQFTSQGTQATHYFDNINTVPPPQALTLDRSDALGLSDSVTVVSDATYTASDTMGLADARTSASVLARADTESLTDSATSALAAVTSATDTFGLTDTVALSVVLARTDVEGLTDVATTVQASVYAATDSVGLTDSVSTAVVLTRTDAETLTDAASSVWNATAAFSDSLSLSDVMTPEKAGAGTLESTDTLGLTDAQAVGVTTARADTESLTDSVATAWSTSLAQSDPLGITDSETAATGLARSDTESLSDTATTALAVVTSAVDALGLTDSVALSLAVAYSATDTLGLTDARTMGVTLARSDTEGLADALTTARDIPVTLTDSLGLADPETAAVGLDRTDTEALTDTTSALSISFLTFSDSTGLADGMTSQKAGAGTLDQADMLGLTDTDYAAITTSRTDSLGLTDLVSISLLTATKTDPLGLSDTWAMAEALARADGLNLSDSVTFTAAWALSLTDTLGLTDSAAASGAGTFGLADALSLTDTATVVLTRTLSDLVGLADTRTALATRTLSDLVGLSDLASTGAIAGAAGRPKVYSGSAFVAKPGKIWNGSAWVEKPWKRWDGTQWKALGGAAWDADTQAYLTATGLNASYAPALDGLVTGLKAKGLWAKMHAIYPFIGGTADLHKWNLKDPRDLDAAYRLDYYIPPGGEGRYGVHSASLGYRPNPRGDVVWGGCARTYLIPLGTLDQNSTHLAYYSMLDEPPLSRCEMGCYNWAGSGSRFHIIARYTPSEYYYGMSEDGAVNTTVPAASGLFVATRTASNLQAGYRNGISVGTSTAPSIPLPNVEVFIGAINEFPDRSDLPCGFASVGTGLSPQDNADLYTVVQAYQTALGRQV